MMTKPRVGPPSEPALTAFCTSPTRTSCFRRARSGMPIANALLLDTHVWLEVALGRERGFSPRLRRQLEAAAAASRLYVAAITPWEVAALIRKGRVRVST